MNIRSLSVGTLIALCSISLGVLARAPANEITCSTSKEQVACVLALAATALEQIDSPREWVAGATELAVALGAEGKRDRALELLDRAIARSHEIPNPADRIEELIALGTILTTLESLDRAEQVASSARHLLTRVEDAQKRWDLYGKLTSSEAKYADADLVLMAALSIPQNDSALASFKARTLREISATQAQKGDFQAARKTLDQLSMGLSYYHATARSDIALSAFAKGKTTLAIKLLENATTIARAQSNGYYRAGMLRDVAEALSSAGMSEQAAPLFQESIVAARVAASTQEQARALSRAATGLSDYHLFQDAIPILEEAESLAHEIESENVRFWALYEIAGSWAFAGQYDRALALAAQIPAIPYGSAQSLRGAVIRDIAWGMARHGQLNRALEAAKQISTAREKVQAFSRIVRVLNQPSMTALPRYL